MTGFDHVESAHAHWFVVERVGVLKPGVVQATGPAPRPVGLYLIGAHVRCDGTSESETLGVVFDATLTGQALDALRASAEAEGVWIAVTAANDQASAVRKAEHGNRRD